MQTLELKKSQIFEAKELFSTILSKKIFPSFTANNIVLIDEKIETLTKESDILTKSFGIEDGVDEKGNKKYKYFLYFRSDNGQYLQPVITQKYPEGVEFSEEVVNEIFKEIFTEEQLNNPEIQKPNVMGYIVEPTKFQEFVSEQENLHNQSTEIEFYPLLQGIVDRTENEGKLDECADILIKLKKFGYYK